VSRGVRPARLFRVHILRNAALPFVTMLGVQIGSVIGGAVVVETVFSWPGLGRLAFDALIQRDFNVLLGILLCSSVLVVLVNWVVDALYRLLDPRVRTA
jgi:peptide/nickel transport system permease protein